MGVTSVSIGTYGWAHRRITSCMLRSKFLMEMLLTNSRHPLSLRQPRPFVLSCSGLIFSQSYHRMVFFSYSLVSAILPREVLSCSLFIGAVFSWLLICLVAARELANSRPATAEKIGFPAVFLVAICNCRDKYIVHNCIQLRQVLLDVGHCRCDTDIFS